MLKHFLLALILFTGPLIGAASADDGDHTAKTQAHAESSPEARANNPSEWIHYDALVEVLAKQDTKTKARYTYRHPVKTLAFFGVEPGMTVVDIQPGKTWYGKILADFLGASGKVIGADIPQAMFESYPWVSDERKEARKSWVTTWPAEMAEAAEDNDGSFGAYKAGSLPDEMRESADLVLMIRALHSANRFATEKNEPFLQQILSDAYLVLKPGGKLGVIQHRAPESASDAWANGSKGYLKQSHVINLMKEAGFSLIASSEMNANPMDRPGEGDSVWRLPPSLNLGDDASEADIQASRAIGESDRMTLLFVKM